MSNDEVIYKKLLKAIVEHQLPPGSRLPEDRLCEAFNVSRTGIRKVLQRLSLERFVLIQTNKGAQVNKPGAKEANEVFDTRILIESQLIPDLMQRWNLQQSERFRNMLDQEDQAAIDNDFAASIQLTARFHYELAKVAGNSVLANFVEQLCYRSSLVIAAYGCKNSVSCDCGEHCDFINILDSGDTVKAQSWMKQHLQLIKSSLTLDRKKDTEIDFLHLFAN